MSAAQPTTPTQPQTPTVPSAHDTPHSYQSFGDLVQSPTSPHARKGIFSQTFSRFPSAAIRGAAGGARERGGSGDAVGRGGAEEDEIVAKDGPKRRTLGTLDLVNLTVGLAGAQLTWTVEMAYGTPYLLSLGLTKQGTSLVWMAGPLSGLIVQPLVGALSDSSNSRYRRRFYIVVSAALIVISTLFVAYARQLSDFICSLSGLGDWDPSQKEREQTVAIWIGVVGFYVLDFSLNGLQASLRALVLDKSPTSQQNLSNAWLGRQTHLANIFGYLFGYFDLGHFSGLAWVGGGQFRKLAVISCTVMSATVAVTCVTQKEDRRRDSGGRGARSAWRVVLGNVKENIRTLPLPVRRVCYVQFFAWTSWFPFLFYATTYVAEALYSSLPPDAPTPSPDTATRAGSFALLIYALVSLAAGAFIPYLTTLGDQPFFQRLSYTSRSGRMTRLILSSITPSNCWTFGLWTYAVGIVGTFFASGPKGATAVVAFLGIPWAITCWVPFALVMEYIRELENESPSPGSNESSPILSSTPASSSSPARKHSRPPFRATNRQTSFVFPTRYNSPPPPSINRNGRENAERALTECDPLLPPHGRYAKRALPPPLTPQGERQSLPPSGGTILGIHNLAIVAPQFFVAIVSAVIFQITSPSVSKGLALVAQALPGGNDQHGGGGGGEGELKATNDVVWVLRFGGLAAIGGAFASRYLIKPRTEAEYVERVLYGDQLEGEDTDAEGEGGRIGENEED
ncbi:hypothetical protein JCM21900_002938 [Sporobolomyces salmonicolor]